MNPVKMSHAKIRRNAGENGEYQTLKVRRKNAEDIQLFHNRPGKKTVPGIRRWFKTLRDSNPTMPEDLSNALTGYADSLETLAKPIAKQEERDAAYEHLTGLHQFLTKNYAPLFYESSIAEMSLFAEMLEKLDDSLNLGLNIDRYQEREDNRRKAFTEDVDRIISVDSNYLSQDKELLKLLYDTRINADGTGNKDCKKCFSELENNRFFRSLNKSETREKGLNDLRDALKRVPEENRSESQKKAIDAIFITHLLTIIGLTFISCPQPL